MSSTAAPSVRWWGTLLYPSALVGLFLGLQLLLAQLGVAPEQQASLAALPAVTALIISLPLRLRPPRLRCGTCRRRQCRRQFFAQRQGRRQGRMARTHPGCLGTGQKAPAGQGQNHATPRQNLHFPMAQW